MSTCVNDIKYYIQIFSINKINTNLEYSSSTKIQCRYILCNSINYIEP